MNTRAYNFVVGLRAVLSTLPGATAISLHGGERWTLVLITVSSDGAVIALGEDLGLGEAEIRTAVGRWWRRATSERDHGALRVEVAGPHHMGRPPGEDEGEPSS